MRKYLLFLTMGSNSIPLLEKKKNKSHSKHRIGQSEKICSISDHGKQLHTSVGEKINNKTNVGVNTRLVSPPKFAPFLIMGSNSIPLLEKIK